MTEREFRENCPEGRTWSADTEREAGLAAAQKTPLHPGFPIPKYGICGF